MLLLSAFIGTIGYVYGVTDAGQNVGELWARGQTPQYGKEKDLVKVRDHVPGFYCGTNFVRLSMNYGQY